MTNRTQTGALDALDKNRRRREAAEKELDAVRAELRRLLTRGQAAGLDVTAMAEAAGVSRETAHKALREAALTKASVWADEARRP
jgi:hypothetical protein